MRDLNVTAKSTTAQLRALADAHSAHNYHPLPVVIAHGEGAWVTDVEGRRYLDLLAAYSALNFGHRPPRLVAAAQRQLERVTLVSRAFDHDQFGPFCAELASLAGMEMVPPINTGTEAVETAIKTASKRADGKLHAGLDRVIAPNICRIGYAVTEERVSAAAQLATRYHPVS